MCHGAGLHCKGVVMGLPLSIRFSEGRVAFVQGQRRNQVWSKGSDDRGESSLTARWDTVPATSSSSPPTNRQETMTEKKKSKELKEILKDVHACIDSIADVEVGDDFKIQILGTIISLANYSFGKAILDKVSAKETVSFKLPKGIM